MAANREAIEKLIGIMSSWQKIEDTSVKTTTEVIKKSDNPLVHLVMEIIRQDSVMHRRVQQLIIDHFRSKSLALTQDEFSGFWEMIAEHNVLEKKTIALAKEALIETESPYIKFLIDYLLVDEEKHDNLLAELEKMRNGTAPYSAK